MTDVRLHLNAVRDGIDANGITRDDGETRRLARVALSSLAAELERLEAERDEVRTRHHLRNRTVELERERNAALAARVEQLEAALDLTIRLCARVASRLAVEQHRGGSPPCPRAADLHTDSTRPHGCVDSREDTE